MTAGCAACGFERTANTVNMTDTGGGVLIDLCRQCRQSIGRRDDRFGSGCVFCGSRASNSRSTGIVYPQDAVGDGCGVCDLCRVTLFRGGETPRTPADRRKERGLEPGDRVVDREANDENPSQGVVLRLTGPAADVEVSGLNGNPTVADLNERYDPESGVAVVAFKSDLGRNLDEWRNVAPAALLEQAALAGVQTYSYPEPRLVLVDERTVWAKPGPEVFK